MWCDLNLSLRCLSVKICSRKLAGLNHPIGSEGIDATEFDQKYLVVPECWEESKDKRENGKSDHCPANAYIQTAVAFSSRLVRNERQRVAGAKDGYVGNADKKGYRESLMQFTRQLFRTRRPLHRK